MKGDFTYGFNVLQEWWLRDPRVHVRRGLGGREVSPVYLCLPLSFSVSPVCPGIEDVSPYTGRFPSRKGACFKPLECQIHAAVAFLSNGVNSLGLFKERDSEDSNL